MKLILANNQTERFVSFYAELRQRSPEPFDFAGYKELLFTFDANAEQCIEVWHLGLGRSLRDYNGVYINGYQEVYTPGAKPTDLYELAATVAVACDSAKISYVNHEMGNGPSLSKLSMHAKLANAGVQTPKTWGGTRWAILAAKDKLHDDVAFPAILKRADADRGIDNFKVSGWDDIERMLQDREDTELWLLQQFVPNPGYYLVSFYGGEAAFSIFRAMQERPDGDVLKGHMYKPKGGTNASLIELQDVPQTVLRICKTAVDALNRQIGSVDCIYDAENDQAYVLEVNYNPQLVTIETFKDIRQQALLDGLGKI